MNSFDGLWLLLLALLGAGLAVLTRGMRSSHSETALELEEDGSESDLLPNLAELEPQFTETELDEVHQPETIEITDELNVKEKMNSINENVIEDTSLPKSLAQPAEQPTEISGVEANLVDTGSSDSAQMEVTETIELEEQLEESQVETQAEATEATAESAESTLATMEVLSSLNPADVLLSEAEAKELPSEQESQSEQQAVESQDNPLEQATVNPFLLPEHSAQPVDDTAEPVDSITKPISAVEVAMAKIIPIETREFFNVRMFQQAFVDMLYYTRHKTLQTTTDIDSYIALASMVRARLLLRSTQPLPQTKMRVEISTQFALGLHLENHLANLGLLNPVCEALQELGLDFNSICEQENLPEQGGDGLGCLVSSQLDICTTAGLAAMGYGLYYDEPSYGPEDQAEYDPTRAIWELEQPAAKVEVKFGGYTEFYTDAQGHYRKRWVAAETVQVVPFDLLISGYETDTINRVRWWKADDVRLQQPYTSPVLNSSDQQQELSLKQVFVLASCAVQDLIRMHLEAERPLETLPDQFQVQLNDSVTALTLAELMHQLVDEHQLDWEQAWSITENLCGCRLYHVTATAHREQWSIEQFNQLFPRHLEIINEINRRFLDQVRSQFPQDEARIGRMSLIDETGRHLRMLHLACVGSNTITGVYPLHTQSLQRTLLADFDEIYAERFRYISVKITPRRFFVQSNPRLTNLITQWLGDVWMMRPEQLQQLESLINNVKFCANWWEAKRAAKQDLIHYIQRRTGITVNLNSLFDVQAMPIEANKRQLLNLLHIVTLYARLKTNASTDTIQRFAHRSVPRTCLFVGAAMPNNPVAAAIAQLIQAVADAINGDPDVQGRLQVIVLADNRYQTIRHVYAATDLAEQIPLADQDVPSLLPLQFALNGVITIGTPNSANLELRQAVGAKNLFLFGMTATEAEHLNAKYDPWQLYDTIPDLKQALDLIASGYFSYGNSSVFKPLIEWLINNDPNLVLADYQSYMNCQERISQAFQDQKNWTWMSILTIAQMGQFLSDSIAE